jgi:hypothetical protein
MGMNNNRIVQMMPADGWYARYVFSEPPYYRLEPLVAWVLVDVGGDPKDRWIRGFESGNEMQPPNLTDEESPIFREYVHREHRTEALIQLWAEEGKHLAAEH